MTGLIRGLALVFVGDPLHPWEAGTYPVSPCYTVTISGNYAYTAEDDGGLRIFDISNPEDPVEVGNEEEAGLTEIWMASTKIP